MVVIRGVSGGTNVPGARSTRGASGGFRVGGGADEAREANASTGVSAATAMGLLAVQELGPAKERNARAFRRAVDELVQPFAGDKIDQVAGIEARGFILGGAVAHHLSSGFVPIRKKGKLPHKAVSIAYSLEYGVDEMEMHSDGVLRGERVILVDDLIATGGTAEGAVNLLSRLGAEVVAACFIVDLPDLGGAARLREAGIEVRALMEFEGD
jgi:adenine phosphoribosyltransferase